MTRHHARHAEPRAGAGSSSVGVALGGGGARGLSHIVVLEALDELGVKPAVVAGTSIGAIVGAAYAAGMTGAELRRHALDTFRHRGEVFSRLWRARSTARFADILAPTLANPAQLNAERLLAAFLPDAVPDDFERLAIPFVAVASDYYGWKAVGLSTGSVHRAVAASMAIPMMFRPVVVDGRIMVDGGVTDPLPIGFVADRADIVVAVDVVNGPKGDDPDRVPSPYEAIFGATQLLMQAVVAARVAQRPPERPDPARHLDLPGARLPEGARHPARLRAGQGGTQAAPRRRPRPPVTRICP